ncbi:hypothetical protein AURDEDRAFT_174043, partial [Auricularia subglabra TFB-10046 SS5]
YVEWAAEKKRKDALATRGRGDDRGYRPRSPSTAFSPATSVPASTGIPGDYIPAAYLRNDDWGYEPSHPQQSAGHTASSVQYAAPSSDPGGQTVLMESLVQSLIRSTDNYSDLATTLVKSDIRRRETFESRGKRRHGGNDSKQSKPVEQEQPVKRPKFAKLKLSGDDESRARVRINLYITDYLEGGRAPKLSNVEIAAITPEQRALMDNESARRCRLAEQKAADAESAAGKKAAASKKPRAAAASDEDADGEPEEPALKDGPAPMQLDPEAAGN